MSTVLRSEGAILDALARKYAGLEWVFIRSVPDTTGGANRTADAVAMNCWRSRGLEIHGFEVKVSRGDLLRELKDPSKADKIARYCDRWWLALGDKALVKEADEIPGPWGILVPRGQDLVVKKQAAKLESQEPRRPFLAAVLRCVVNQRSDKAQIEEARQTGRRDAEASMESQREWMQQDLKELRERVTTFEKASGVNISNKWTEIGPIGEAVQLVLHDSATILRNRLEAIDDEAQRLAKATAEALEKVRAA